MTQIDRLETGITPSGRTFVALVSPSGAMRTVLSDLPAVEQVRLLKEWALDVRNEEADIDAGPEYL